MATVDRNRLPLYRQVAQELRQGIQSGAWTRGAQLPSEPELARHYAVSRATVREALRVLEQDGIVTASRGLGTFVRANDHLPHVGINTLYSITDVIRQQGYTPSITDVKTYQTTLRDAFEGDPPGDQAALPLDEPVVVIERTRLADGRPVAYTHDAVPLRLLAGRPWEDRLRSGSLFELLREAGTEVDYTCTRIFAVEAPREAARRLELKPGAPLLMTEETVYDRAGRPLVVARDFYRTDHIEMLVVRDRK